MLTRISKGFQVTIPADWRRALGLGKGSNVNMELNKQAKQVIIEPVDAEAPDFKELFRQARKYKHRLTPKDLEKLEEDLYE